MKFFVMLNEVKHLTDKSVSLCVHRMVLCRTQNSKLKTQNLLLRRRQDLPLIKRPPRQMAKCQRHPIHLIRILRRDHGFRFM